MAPKINISKIKEFFETNGGESISKFYISSFFIAVLNTLLFCIGFSIQDNHREIQQGFVLPQIILSILQAIIFFIMFVFEKNHSLNKISYFVLALLSAINSGILGGFYDLNKQNSQTDKDNSEKMGLFCTSYFINILIFGLSIFLCTRMFKARNYANC